MDLYILIFQRTPGQDFLLALFLGVHLNFFKSAICDDKTYRDFQRDSFHTAFQLIHKPNILS